MQREARDALACLVHHASSQRSASLYLTKRNSESTSASTAISSGSMLTKLRRLFHASRTRSLRTLFADTLHRRQRRHCWHHYVLRTEFSADATRFSDALGFFIISLDSIARLVRFRPLVLFQIIGTLEQRAGMSSVSSARAFRRRGCGRSRVARLAKTEGRTSNARMTKASEIRMKTVCHFVFSI